MADSSDRRGYETPIMADVETGVRRLLRFQVKLILAVLVVLLVGGGVVAGIVITRENKSVTVPDVRGRDNVGVATSFDRTGLAFDFTRIEQASSTIPFGHVIKTDPAAGERAKRGAVVRVFFSCGAPRPGFCDAAAP
jgi:beta-lactam-binding protein with PASTA domain